MSYSLLVVSAAVAGSPVTLIVVSLPFRVWQNLVQPGRRRRKIKETLACIFTFPAVLNAASLMIATYPPDW